MKTPYCCKCGLENPIGAHFCGRCGEVIIQFSAEINKFKSHLPPVTRGEMVAFGLLTILLPFIGALVGLIAGIIWTSTKRRGGSRFLLFVCTVLFLGLTMLTLLFVRAYPGFELIRSKAKEAEAKQNLYYIQLELERYATDQMFEYALERIINPRLEPREGFYPSDINDLIKYGLLSEFPINPLSDLANPKTITERPRMKPVPAKIFSPGDFVYAPVVGPDGSITKYSLSLYGSEKNSGYILILEYDSIEE